MICKAIWVGHWHQTCHLTPGIDRINFADAGKKKFLTKTQPLVSICIYLKSNDFEEFLCVSGRDNINNIKHTTR